MKTGLLVIIPIVAMSLVGITIFGLTAMSSGVDHDIADVASTYEPTCENQIIDNKSPTIYNVTPTSDGAIVRWYQTPQTVNGVNCGFPESYKIQVGLKSPIDPAFEILPDLIHPGGFRGAYAVTGLEPSTTYYVDVKGDWGVEITTSDEDVEFTTLNLEDKIVLSNPIEKAKYEMSKKFSEHQNQTVSEWDFRNLPSYVIIPSGVVIDGNQYLIPEEITVVLGKNNTVTWSNEDDVAHTLLSDDKNNPWTTGLMRPGELSSVKFNSTGIFSYHGTPGPWITGTVIVLEN